MITFSPKQLQAYQGATCRMVGYCGAVRSGKSFTANFKFADMCYNAPPGALILCGASQDSLKRNVIEELYNTWGEAHVKYFPGKRELNFLGRQVYCVGASDERAEKRIRGPTFSGALVDEATILPESFFKMLYTRLSREGSQLIFTTNPDSPFHWLKRDYIDRASQIDMKCFSFILDDNPSLAPSIRASYEATFKGLWYKRFILGEWCLAEGAVYDFFDEKVHVISSAPSFSKYYLLGVDYGTSNTCTFVLLGFNDRVYPNMWVEKEYYFDSREEGYQKTDSDYSEDLARFIEGYGVTRCYIDPSAASFKTEIRRTSPQLKCIDAKNDVLNGIRVVSKHLGDGNLKILARCTNMIREFQSYTWDTKRSMKGEDVPIKAHDHSLDALRYIIFTHWGEKQSLLEPTLEEKQAIMQQKKYGKNPMSQIGWGLGWEKL